GPGERHGLGQPALGERPQLPPAAAPRDRHLAAALEDRQHHPHVPLIVPLARGPADEGPILERGQWKRAFAPEPREHLAPQQRVLREELRRAPRPRATARTSEAAVSRPGGARV